MMPENQLTMQVKVAVGNCALRCEEDREAGRQQAVTVITKLWGEDHSEPVSEGK